MSSRPNSLPLAPRGLCSPPAVYNRAPHAAQMLSPRSPSSTTAEEKSLLSPRGDGAQGHAERKDDVVYVNVGEEDQSEVYGYCRSTVGTALTWLMIVATAGLLRLIFHWQPKWMLYATHSQCGLDRATRVLLVEHYKKYKRFFVKEISILEANEIRLEPEYSMLTGGVNTTADGESVFNKAPSNEKPPSETLRTLLVPNSKGVFNEQTSVRLFRCKKSTYIWGEDEGAFYRLPTLSQGHTTTQLHSFTGLSWQQQARRRIVFGPNCINVPIKPIPKLLFQEALNPFYIFQVFSVILWYTDDYMYYATVIVVTSVVSLISEVYQMNRNQVALSKTIQSSDVVEVLREGGHPQSIPSEQLVPGDVLLVPAQGCMMQCDAVLLQGNAIVNESMLTGESVPVTKTPVIGRTDIVYTDKEHGKHTLYCGTEVIQTRFYGGERVRAVVVRTGFSTNKGALVRSIMYPPPVDFKFQQDSYKFVLVLVFIASFGFLYTVITKYLRGVTVANIMLDSFDLITIVIPPALPMAMTVGILYALQRLKIKNIFCISPRSVNISGVLNCICFDKTGTLTEDGLDLRGVVPVSGRVDIRGSMRKPSSKMANATAPPHPSANGSIGDAAPKKHPSVKNVLLQQQQQSMPTKIFLGSLDKEPMYLANDHLLFAMASCHSITIINLEMVGDPLELRMFESTGWVLEEPGLEDTNKYDMMMPSTVHPKRPDCEESSRPETDESVPLEIGILRQFPFESTLQRMSVITRRLGDKHWDLYCKGSPEKIASLSSPESVPPNFNAELREYTDQGYRVLALAHKPISMPYHKVQKVDREELECNMQFLGLLVMENRLKKESKDVIQQLKQANIRTVMVTGDNLLTALSVGRECALVSPLDTVLEVHLTPQGALCFEPTTPPKEVADQPLDGSVTVDIDHGKSDPTLLAIDGKNWAAIQEHHQDLLDKLLVRGVVFARMNPDQKQQLITQLQELGYYVGMCGDGANDCGALKAAHAGISLSEAEASVASPFTSKDPNISCVPNLIREGRTALVTSFGVFKYMAAYSLTQFMSTMILYSIDGNLTDFQFLYVDLFLITVFAVFFGRTESYKGNLHPTSPPAALMSLTPILSLLLHMVLVITFQTLCFFYIQEQPWYVPFNATNSDEVLGGHENYAVFSISLFQYIVLAVAFSRGPPYRQPLYTNKWLCGSLIVMTIASFYIILWPDQFFVDLFELVMPPAADPDAMFFRYQIAMFALLYSVLAIFVEYVIVDYLIYQTLRPKLHNAQKSKKKYINIEHKLSEDKLWPPSQVPPPNGVGETTWSQSHSLNANGLTNKFHPPKTETNSLKRPSEAMIQYQSSL